MVNRATIYRQLLVFHRNRENGFSLIEVVIALAVLALAMSALIDSSTSATANTIHLQEKTFAHWVAMNRMTEFRLGNPWPKTGTTKGKTTMADQEWAWEAKVSETPEKKMRRIDVRVRYPDDPEDTSITLLTGFLRQPARNNPR